jgi:hypothetical protein
MTWLALSVALADAGCGLSWLGGRNLARLREAISGKSKSDVIVAERRGSLFLAVMLTCDIDVQVSRIDNPDRVALRKGSDPEGYRGHRLSSKLYQPPPREVIRLDTTEVTPASNAWRTYQALHDRGSASPADRRC